MATERAYHRPEKHELTGFEWSHRSLICLAPFAQAFFSFYAVSFQLRLSAAVARAPPVVAHEPPILPRIPRARPSQGAFPIHKLSGKSFTSLPPYPFRMAVLHGIRA